jgi:hypothetical protein
VVAEVTHPLAEKGLFNANPRWKDAVEKRKALYG